MREQVEYDFIAENVERVYTFVIESYELYSVPRDYGSGDKMTMAEIHTLSLIADNPGLSVSGVSKMWNRTVSAASQNINKLVKKKLVVKKKEPGDCKTVHLYVTPNGQRLSDLHKAYDRKGLSETVQILLQTHTMDELKTALRVIESGIQLVEKLRGEKETR